MDRFKCIIISLLVLLACGNLICADIIYVKEGASGTGSSWSNAYGDLQDTLEAADPCDNIWVAAGTYKPDPSGLTDSREASFQMKNGVGIYGGFAATGDPVWEDRDPDIYVTILSGDLLGNDNPATLVEDLRDDPCRADNCYHIFYHPSGTNLYNTAILDGFTITGGNANISSSTDYCFGGGVFNYSSDPTLSNCKFIKNSSSYKGGAIFNDYYSYPKITGCQFINNRGNFGAAISNYDSSSKVTDCVFNGNYSLSSSAIFDEYSYNTITNCIFYNNRAEMVSGSIYGYVSNLYLKNCIFIANSASYCGAIYASKSDLSITTCTFSKNTADRAGALGISETDLSLTNSILWGNIALEYNEIYIYSGTPIIKNCDIAGCGGSGSGWDNSLGTDGGGNIDADPLFVDAASNDFHLQPASPCIDRGDNNAPYLPETDFEGDPRIIYSYVDMGADEAEDAIFDFDVSIHPFPTACSEVVLDPPGGRYAVGTEVSVTVVADENKAFHSWSGDMTGNDNPVIITMDTHKNISAKFVIDSEIIYVNSEAMGLNNGISWSDALNELQDALTWSGSGQEIWVAEGSYYPDPCGLADPRQACFQLKNGLAIYGGFPGTGNPTWLDRDLNMNPTILSGDLLNNDNQGSDVSNLLNDPCRADNCYHVFYHPEELELNETAILDGFTISAGNANGSSTQRYGAGMYNYLCSPTITGNIFCKNSTGLVGGGIYNCQDSNSIVSNCMFAENYADYSGAGIYNTQSNLTITNCTLTGNYSGSYGGGMYNFDSNPTVINCILWGNNAVNGPEIYNTSSITANISYCNIAGCGGSGDTWDDNIGNDMGNNIDADPLFVDAANGDIHLQATSPCINNGNNDAPNLLSFDFEGDPRIIHGVVDIGVDEFTGVVQFEFSLSIDIKPFERAFKSMTLDPPGGMYPLGTEVTITVKPEDGYVFTHWSVDLDGNNNPATIVMDSNKSVISHFSINSDVIYVDLNATGLNNGSSWINALTVLQEALDMAWPSLNDEIWVATGKYHPTSDYGLGIGDRGRHFRMKNDIKIYGGFSNTGAAVWEDRDPDTYISILSGDLLGNDNPALPVEDIRFDPCRADNCYHVFYHPDGWALDPNAAVDGFLITGGHAIGSGNHNYGAGMYNCNNNPTISNCTFSRNYASEEGGGVFNNSSNSIYNNCTISDNLSALCGGVYNSSSSLTFIDCTLSDNSAFYWNVELNNGGGMYNYGCDLSLIGCTFSNNEIIGAGGGIYNYQCNLIVTDCVFNSNYAYWGGAMYNNYSNLSVINCVFSNNVANYNGAGMYNSHNSSQEVKECTFINNSSRSDSGGMFNYGQSNTRITNCNFFGNSAEQKGGGIYNRDDINTRLTACIFSGNTASEDGGGLYCKESELDVINTVFLSNNAARGNNIACDSYQSPSTIIMANSICRSDADPIWNNDGSDITINFSNVEGDWVGLGNIDADPCFVDADGDDNLPGTEDDDLRLQAFSPCIDVGDNSVVTEAFDLDGKTRIMDGDGDGVAVVDMGAYEYSASITGVYVFYNNSRFDGYDPGPDMADEVAIAIDKFPLRPGQTATSANYTSYSRGINGIMVDIAFLTGTPSEFDFIFRVGNDDEPAGWAMAPAPAEVSIRPGVIFGGADRITIIWPDNAIQKQWLEVTVLANENTGLMEDYTFYFGNAIGDTCNSSDDTFVNALDTGGVRDHPKNFLNPAAIDDLYDFNRDKSVNALDFGIARDNATNFLNALELISVP
ncbi:MAG: right-handed parallel beta-helix repeat-containing protein [Sedimentisphaerales bacterium]|nr:right-handed parallel beta-helix repeat-containing protein [Sedimentisphaerales bacterium]